MTPRPPQEELLDDQIQVRFSERELKHFRAHAKAMRTSPQEIMRELARQWLEFADARGPSFLFALTDAPRIQAVAETAPEHHGGTQPPPPREKKTGTGTS